MRLCLQRHRKTLHTEANILWLQLSPSSWAASFCSSSSPESQDCRRWPAVVQGEASSGPATSQHVGAQSLAQSLTLQKGAGSFRPACWGRLPSLGRVEGGAAPVLRNHSLRHTGKGSLPTIYKAGLRGTLSWSPEDGSRTQHREEGIQSES